ncbi:MFS transporter [Glacieibacterium frigidum]|uniref:MFS transporter n=2 Tax=Glacieibacterium frigidum TaxID=2593303 RepID=A0A552UAM7_9SPHN|nr:MFS transporter [Glacieibacterium frigidum]
MPRLDGLAPTIRRNWPTLLVLAVVVAMAFLSVGSFSAVQEAAKAELRLSDVMLGTIQGVSAAVPLVLLSAPAGAAVDRVNRMHLLLGMSVIWTMGTLGTAFAGSAAMLFVARMLASIGIAGALTAAISIAADLCGQSERGRAMLILTLGKSAGQAAAFSATGALFGFFQIAGPSLGELSAWRASHVILAIAAAVLTLPLLMLREPARQETQIEGTRPPFGVVLRSLWARRSFILPLFAGGVAVAMADTAAAIWAAPVLGRAFNLTPDQFGGWMGAIMLVTGIVGAVTGGLAADWGQKRGRILFPAILAAGLSVPAALFPVMGSVTGFAVVLALFAFSGYVIGVIIAAVLAVTLPNEMRGLGIGIFLALAGLVAFGLAPPLVGWIATLLGGEAHLPAALALVATTVSAFSLVCFIIAARRPI